MLSAQVQAWVTGGISQDTFFDNLREAKLISKNVSNEQEKERISKDQENEMNTDENSGSQDDE